MAKKKRINNAQNIKKDNPAFQIIIGMFIGMFAISSLQEFLQFPDLLWLTCSVAIVFISMILIYTLMWDKQDMDILIESVRMATIFLVSFLPFSLIKVISSFSETTKNFQWTPLWFVIHLSLVLGALCSWLAIKKAYRGEKYRGIIIVGGILIFISWILYIILNLFVFGV